MIDTVELIGKYTQNLSEHMSKNDKCSFYRFPDGFIHYINPLFNDTSITKDVCSASIEPVEELEELKKIIKNNDVLVTINDFVVFEGRDAFLGETGIVFYGLSVEIKYAGIRSLIVDCYHDLKALIREIKQGYFGEFVFINGFKRNIQDLKIEKNGIDILFPEDNMDVLIEHDCLNLITDNEGEIIYRR